MKVYSSMKIKNSGLKIEYYTDSERDYWIFTDDLKYRENQEIIFDDKKQCFTIKNLERLRNEWRKLHPDDVIEEKVFKNFMEVKIK